MQKTVRHGSRRDSPRLGAPRGRAVASRQPGPHEKAFDISAGASLRAAAQRRAFTPAARTRASSGPFFDRRDIRIHLRRRSISALVVFVLDVSDSMGAHERIRDAKASIIGLLKTAHLMRCRVALIAVQGKKASLIVPPSSSVQAARRGMRGLGPAGGTPLASGLRLALRTIRNEELKSPGIEAVLLVVSDGEATVPLGAYGDPYLELIRMAKRIKRRKEILSICIDTKEESSGSVGRSEMRGLAEALGARYYHRSRLGARRSRQETSY